MKKNFAYSVDFDSHTEKLFKKANYLGQGNNGIVYQLDDRKAIKIFLKKKVCNDEAAILFKTNGSKYFPRIYKRGSLYVVRDMVYGERLDFYIKKNGLNQKLIKNIYSLLREFKRLKFKKLDTRCKDVYVGENCKLMMIDPKKAYKRKVDYPRHLMKNLNRIGQLEKFIEGIGKINYKISIEWKKKFETYCENEIWN